MYLDIYRYVYEIRIIGYYSFEKSTIRLDRSPYV